MSNTISVADYHVVLLLHYTPLTLHVYLTLSGSSAIYDFFQRLFRMSFFTSASRENKIYCWWSFGGLEFSELLVVVLKSQ